MMYANAVQIAGNLGKDPETRTVGNRQVTRFTIASTKRWKRDGKTHEKTNWVKIVAWGSVAQYAASLRKGDPVLIQGELDSNEFTGDDKVKRTVWEVIARAIYKIDFSKSPAATENEDAETDPSPEDVPF